MPVEIKDKSTVSSKIGHFNYYKWPIYMLLEEIFN